MRKWTGTAEEGERKFKGWSDNGHKAFERWTVSIKSDVEIGRYTLWERHSERPKLKRRTQGELVM